MDNQFQTGKAIGPIQAFYGQLDSFTWINTTVAVAVPHYTSRFSLQKLQCFSPAMLNCILPMQLALSLTVSSVPSSWQESQ